jgi:hypothetical protein
MNRDRKKIERNVAATGIEGITRPMMHGYSSAKRIKNQRSALEKLMLKDAVINLNCARSLRGERSGWRHPQAPLMLRRTRHWADIA